MPLMKSISPAVPQQTGESLLTQSLGLPADGRVVKPVGAGEVRAVEIRRAADPGKGQVARLQVFAGLELGVFVVLAEIALDASIGKGPQLRPAVDRFHVTEVISQHAQQLLQVREPKVCHELLVDLGSAFVFYRDAVVTAALEGTQHALAGIHIDAPLQEELASGRRMTKFMGHIA